MGCRRRYSPRCRHDPARLPVSREPSRLARGLGALCDELAFHLIVGSALARTHRGPRHLELALQELVVFPCLALALDRSEEHTSELQSLMRLSYATFCFEKQIYKLLHEFTKLPNTTTI